MNTMGTGEGNAEKCAERQVSSNSLPDVDSLIIWRALTFSRTFLSFVCSMLKRSFRSFSLWPPCRVQRHHIIWEALHEPSCELTAMQGTLAHGDEEILTWSSFCIAVSASITAPLCFTSKFDNAASASFSTCKDWPN